MSVNNEVLALILGGGQGTRLFPLTHQRSKPAVPIADYYLILAGDHLYRMNYSELVDAHIDHRADITIAALPVSADDASAMGIFRFDHDGQIVAFEEKPNGGRLREIGRSIPAGSRLGTAAPDKPFVASMGIYVFSRDVLLDALAADSAKDFGREIIPAALGRYRVNSFLFRGYWADVGTVDAFYKANIMLANPGSPFKFYDPRRPIYTHPRFLPAARLGDCTVRAADRGQERAHWRRRRPDQRLRDRGGRRRRLLHTRRHHHRSEGRRDQAWDDRLAVRGSGRDPRNSHRFVASMHSRTVCTRVHPPYSAR